MELTNCPLCGKLFIKTTRDICQECYQALEDDFAKVKAYLCNNPNSTVEDIHRETGVPRKRLIRFICEGRINTEQFANIAVYCQLCGKPIKQGKLCDSCRRKLKLNTGSAQDWRLRGKMHLRSRINEKRNS